MTTTIKPIEAKSVHQIQSGQVIVDLCSVAKELVENALDADASSIEVRFKNYGLDSIEVSDNGSGISQANYENLALKHYTSKLSSYDDLSQLQTFGFRGEALSSLCALSTFSVVTAQAHEVPRGNKLEFETSGKLKNTTFLAAQKGTTIVVENLFANLPVRQKELTKNIKREYGKVLGILQAYACISTNVKFTVKHAAPKGRSAVVFSTQGNGNTRENIANVYGAKMLPQLIELELKFEFQPTLTQLARDEVELPKVSVRGHISRPVFGEGRQTPDRQMFFVNGRPCGLPQIAKAINEVYKSYNVSQSPFVFADFLMDTNNYDVNVSPDKRTILLHNAAVLVEKLKEELTKRFDEAEQTVPQSQAHSRKLPGFRALSISRLSSRQDTASTSSPSYSPSPIPEDISNHEDAVHTSEPPNLLKSFFDNVTSTREEDEGRARKTPDPEKVRKAMERQADKIAKSLAKQKEMQPGVDDYDDLRELQAERQDSIDDEEIVPIQVRDFNARIQEQQTDDPLIRDISTQDAREVVRRSNIEEKGVINNAFDTMRRRRPSPETATIVIGDKVITRTLGTPIKDHERTANSAKSPAQSQFSQSLRKFDVDRDVAFDTEIQNDDTTHTETGLLDGDDLRADKSPDPFAIDPLKERDTSDTECTSNERQHASGAHHQQTPSKERSSSATENADRTQEEYRVAELIRLAESTNYANSKEHQRRNAQALKPGVSKDSTTSLIAICELNADDLRSEIASSRLSSAVAPKDSTRPGMLAKPEEDQEQRLSLAISKTDFGRMHIAGQFNLGFIIASRPKRIGANQRDELFIIDQHASDEKYNFERLQAETVVSNQRLVNSVALDLTAVEEEIVLDNEDALQRNGFIVETDTSGEVPVGQRCQLLTLPVSREVTFNTKDLEELIHLLAEAQISANSTYLPRPAKVRKMFAMRACRSSIMIGKTLSRRQMHDILRHMGTIDKPWNCPHGRPTMRHLISLDDLDEKLWTEGQGLVLDDQSLEDNTTDTDVWQQFVK